MSNPHTFWDALISRATHSGVAHTPEAIHKYQSAFFEQETVHAVSLRLYCQCHLPSPCSQTCEDYRASATIDLDHDREDLASDRKISIPALRVLWGAKGMIAKYGDVVAEWKKVCHEDIVEVTGRQMDCGHYIAEEKSEELLQEILDFLQ